MMMIKFKNPPISEIVLGTYFSPPVLALRNEHIGLFWSKIRDQFPNIEQQPMLGGVEMLENEVFPMPRYWFIAEDESNLLQVQKDAFILNWRRRDADYPHFHEYLKPTFDKYFSVFSDFVRKETDADDLNIDLCELSYANIIERCEYWSGPEDTPIILPAFSVSGIGIETIKSLYFNCTYGFVVADDLQLKVMIKNAVEPDNPDEPILIIEIRASGRLGQVSKSDTDPWFDRAHNAIISCFMDMTNEEIQNKYWKPVEESK